MARTTDYKGSEMHMRIRWLIDGYVKGVECNWKPGNSTSFAEYIGRSKQMVNYWYNGERTPGFDVIILISRKCSVSTDWILGEEPFDNSSKDITVKDIAAYTGLSSAAIDLMHLYQEESTNDEHRRFISQRRRIIHLLSWLIVNDYASTSSSGETLFSQMLEFFNTDPEAQMRVYDKDLIDKNEDAEKALVGRYKDGQLLIAKGAGSFYLDNDSYENGMCFSIQERMKDLKKIRQEQFDKAYAMLNLEDDDLSFEDIEVSLGDIESAK